MKNKKLLQKDLKFEDARLTALQQRVEYLESLEASLVELENQLEMLTMFLHVKITRTKMRSTPYTGKAGKAERNRLKEGYYIERTKPATSEDDFISLEDLYAIRAEKTQE